MSSNDDNYMNRNLNPLNVNLAKSSATADELFEYV